MRDTQWLADRGWGVFCHYLATPPSKGGAGLTADEWSRQVDAFDVAGLAGQLDAVGAGYFCITIGQGSGHYCAPNETYDALTGIAPSKCSRRDLVSDLHAELDRRRIPLLVYSAAELSWGDARARAGLGLEHHHSDPGSGGTRIWREHRQVPFMRNVEAIHADWSKRWGSKVRGWWIDGCYESEYRFPEDDPPNFGTLADALRSGNSDALVAFNPGVLVPVICHTEHEDYTAGEIAGALPECPGPWVERNGHRARYHVLTYMGEYWCRGEPRFPDDLVVGYTQHVTSKGGVITWDVPITTGGLILEPFVRQLACLGKRRR